MTQGDTSAVNGRGNVLAQPMIYNLLILNRKIASLFSVPWQFQDGIVRSFLSEFPLGFTLESVIRIGPSYLDQPPAAQFVAAIHPP